ncbi:MAG: FIST C-terminal domain-containing protein [Halarcobacter sp.]
MYESIKYYKEFNQLKNTKLNTKAEYIIFVTENSNIDYTLFLSLNIKFYGAIFPQIIFENKAYEKGILLVELKDCAKVVFFNNMADATFEEYQFEYTKSIMTIFDGFSTSSSKFLEEIFENIKLHTNIFGGGAGYLTKPREKNIFSNSGRFLDAAFFIFLEKKVSLGISHGWEYLEGPFIATKTDKNQIDEIDYENAFEVYKRVIQLHCEEKISRANFLEIAKKYPLGIIKFNGESLIRDPFEIDNKGSIKLAGDIHTNTIFNILKGEKKALIDAASNAAKQASECKNKELFMFECITRLHFLESDLETEIEEIIENSKVESIYGVFSVGEIGNNGDRYINILNKSSVLAGIWH